MATIAIVGPGAIGCTVGAALVEAGVHEVVFCARELFSRLRMQYSGDAVDLPARVLTDESLALPVDWVLLCVKAHQTPAAAGWLRALVSPASGVAVIQNGVEQRETVAPFVPDGAGIAPVVARLPATRTSPGEVVAKGVLNLTSPDDAPGRDFAALFSGTRISAQTAPDFTTDAWKKLCFNTASGAITTLTCRPGLAVENPLIARLARQLILEAVAVGRAEGARLEETWAEELLRQVSTPRDGAARGNSMYFDRVAGRPLEYEARNGVVVRLGAKHGIPTPASSTVVALLSAIQPAQ